MAHRGQQGAALGRRARHAEYSCLLTLGLSIYLVASPWPAHCGAPKSGRGGVGVWAKICANKEIAGARYRCRREKALRAATRGAKIRRRAASLQYPPPAARPAQTRAHWAHLRPRLGPLVSGRARTLRAPLEWAWGGQADLLTGSERTVDVGPAPARTRPANKVAPLVRLGRPQMGHVLLVALVLARSLGHSVQLEACALLPGPKLVAT